jgi:NMD protein affecting ribosome stability and mRNA decay
MANLSYGRKDRLIKERRHDVYQEVGKRPEPTLCTQCGAVYSKGKWSWDKIPKKANKTICPACKRSAANYPAGYIELRGDFFKKNHDVIVNLIRNTEKLEQSIYPLERIMSVEIKNDHTLIMTTGVHIARRIGSALSRSYKGDYSFHYGKSEKSIRIYWER